MNKLVTALAAFAALIAASIVPASAEPQEKLVDFGVARYGITTSGDVEICPYNYEICITFGSVNAPSEANRADFKGIYHGRVGGLCDDLLRRINMDEDTNGTFPVDIKHLTSSLLAKMGMQGEVRVSLHTCRTDTGFWIGALSVTPVRSSVRDDWTFDSMAVEINLRRNPLYYNPRYYRYRH